MYLVIHNHAITAPIQKILTAVREKSGNNYFSSMKELTTGNILVSCPFHKEGLEKHPSCNIVSVFDTPDVYGTFHCWSCGAKGSLSKLVGYCFDKDSFWGETWLLENFGTELIEEVELLKPIQLETEAAPVLDPNILRTYEYSNIHALKYMIRKRKISYDVLRYFCIGYDKDSCSVTFPVWDENNNLVGVTKRSIISKFYYIPKTMRKPVYLLNYVKLLNYTTVYVVESQINALTLWGWGYPAVALFGTGTPSQVKMIEKAGVRNVTLCLDGDMPGKKGTMKLCNLFSDSMMVNIVQMLKGCDVNDLSKEQFEKLSVYDKNSWLKT